MTDSREREALIGALSRLPDQVEEVVRDLSDPELAAAPGDEEWSVAQIVHHIVDSHVNSYVRCKLMATEENPTFKPYDEKRWADLPDATSTDLSYSLAFLRALHTRWVLFWRNLPEEAWSRQGYHPESGPVTLDKQLRLYVEHGETHLDQMRRALAAARRESA